MSLGTIRVATAALRRFLIHGGGSLTIPAIFLFAVLMGVGGLAIDLQRLYGVHGQMQAYVDDAAIAGAAELDGESGALTRSARAACGTPCGGAIAALVTGSQKFAPTPDLTLQKVTFLSVLGTDPGPVAPTPAAGDVVECTYEAGAWTPANCNTNPTKEKAAKFIEVVAAPRTVSYVVLPVADVILQLGGGTPITSSATLRLRATAGFKKQVCDITPLMVCNPSEPVGNANTQFPFTPVAGQEVLMKTKGGGTAWGPGDFGLVSVPADAAGNIKCSGGGAAAIRCMLGLVDPLTQCIDNDTIDVQPGQDSSVADGLNTRFDIYEGAMQQKRTSPDFAPSANVTKGMCKVTGNGNGAQCNYGGGGGGGGNACPNISGNGNGNGGVTSTSTLPRNPTDKRSMPLARDSDISQANRFGNGNWDRNTYWTRNHGGILPGALAGATRYQVYRYEIDNNLTPVKSGVSGEDGRPHCSTQTPVNNLNRDRRTLTMAVVNCTANHIQGNASGVAAVAYVQMFLPEPVGLTVDAMGNYIPDGNTSDYFAEVVSKLKPNDQSGVYHLYPVLYR